MELSDLERRFTYHAPPSDVEINKYKAIRANTFHMAVLINDSCPEGREKSLAVTHLEEAVMWANASIARAGGES